MRVYALGLAAAAALRLAATAVAQADKHPTSITVMSSLPSDTAVERARAAMVDAGYAIAEANPRAITTEGRTFKKGWDLQIVAYVDLIGDSTRLTLMGTYSVTCCGVRYDNMSAEGGRSDGPGQMWKELQIVADTVRRAVSVAPVAAPH
jgi:hypothetical protein